jgi:hypothetical protein
MRIHLLDHALRQAERRLVTPACNDKSKNGAGGDGVIDRFFAVVLCVITPDVGTIPSVLYFGLLGQE